jgi:hypothetical protein
VAVGSAWSAQARVSGPKVCFPRFETLFLSPFFSLCLKNVVLLSTGFETALDESVKNCKALAEAAEQKEAEHVAMSEAISAFCQAFGLDVVPSGSSPHSHLRALGGHVRNRLRGVLHHGVRRAFAVLASHYDVDLERVSEGYLSHPVLEGKPNVNHVRARISNSRTQQLHNMDIITQCSNSIKREIIVDYIISLRHPHSLYNKSKCGRET